MFTVGKLYILACFVEYTGHCIFSTCSHMGLIYTMRGLSALSVLIVGQSGSLGVWDE